MDPIEDIKPAKDTTLAMMLAAQRRGWQLSYLELRHLWLRDGVAFGRAHPLEVRDDAAGLVHAAASRAVEPLGEFDVILMRKDPPFDTEYIYATYILERAEDGRRAGGQPPAGPARHEREGLHGLVPASAARRR